MAGRLMSGKDDFVAARRPGNTELARQFELVVAALQHVAEPFDPRTAASARTFNPQQRLREAADLLHALLCRERALRLRESRFDAADGRGVFTRCAHRRPELLELLLIGGSVRLRGAIGEPGDNGVARAVA